MDRPEGQSHNDTWTKRPPPEGTRQYQCTILHSNTPPRDDHHTHIL